MLYFNKKPIITVTCSFSQLKGSKVEQKIWTNGNRDPPPPHLSSHKYAFATKQVKYFPSTKVPFLYFCPKSFVIPLYILSALRAGPTWAFQACQRRKDTKIPEHFGTFYCFCTEFFFDLKLFWRNKITGVRITKNLLYSFWCSRNISSPKLLCENSLDLFQRIRTRSKIFQIFNRLID